MWKNTAYYPIINLVFERVVPHVRVFVSFIMMLKAIYQSRVLLSVFFDVSAAFNNVNFSVLDNELLSLGIPVKIILWLHKFLLNRQLFVKYNNHLYGPRLSSIGVCQGGILSPLLFILYIRCLNLILGPNIKNLQFADDLVVYASGTDLIEVSENITRALSKLYQYFNYLNLEVNSSKSKVLIFG